MAFAILVITMSILKRGLVFDFGIVIPFFLSLGAVDRGVCEGGCKVFGQIGLIFLRRRI